MQARREGEREGKLQSMLLDYGQTKAELPIHRMATEERSR